MLNLYILNYNNYYNRIVKRESSLANYLSTAYYNNVVISNVNFYMNDGVNTTQVLNSFVSGDYAVLTDNSSGVEKISSRWFIINCKRNCKGQFDLMLRRDLVVDNFDTILNADTFIEKAILQDSDPLILNKENMTVNEIRTVSTLIKDKTQMGYIVGYVDKNFKQDKSVIPENEQDYYTTKANFESSWGTISQIIDSNSLVANYIIYGNELLGGQLGIINILAGTYNVSGYDEKPNLIFAVNDDNQRYTLAQRIKNNANAATLKTALTQDYAGGINSQTIKNISPLIEYNNKVVKDATTNKYYKVTVTGNNTTIKYNVPASGNVYDAMKAITDTQQVTGTPRIAGGPTKDSFVVNMTATVYSYSYQEITLSGYYYTIQDGHTKLVNQLYDMFVIPFTLPTVESPSEKYPMKLPSGTIVYPMYDVAIKVANDIIQKNSTGGTLKDIQILPYFPMQDLVDATQAGISLPSDNNNICSIIYNTNDIPVSAIVWCNTNQFETTIDYNNTIIGYVYSGFVSTNKKINNECDKFRITSPNHQSVFEYSPAKNNMIYTTYIIKATYKPYQPCVQVRPLFSGLYNKYSNETYDARGLLFSGDFSMTQASDAWTQYKRQNVNYLNIFDRQIQNMEIQNKYQNQMSQIASLSSALTTGVGAGLATSNLVAGLGAGVTSAIAGQLDLQIQKDLQSEALDYKQDLFNYQLGNIKALPDTISKVDAYNNVFSIWPQLEFYTCTDEEKKAVAYKIAYNSMSVGKIGKIKDYIQNTWSYGDITSKGYIKGKVIRLEGINEDTHYLNELANEINKGVYFNGDNTTSS